MLSAWPTTLTGADMKIGDAFNEFGVAITVFKCEYCGNEFTVVPAVSDDKLDQWTGCLAPECKSYDQMRDVDALLFFGVIDSIKQVD